MSFIRQQCDEEVWNEVAKNMRPRPTIRRLVDITSVFKCGNQVDGDKIPARRDAVFEDYKDDLLSGKLWKHPPIRCENGEAKIEIILMKVPTRTGPCCTPSTISCHSYGLASHQVLHDLALSCTVSHKKIVKYGSFTKVLIPCNNPIPSTIAPIQIIHTEGFQGCLRSRVETQKLL